jgi:single-strand selective monofunctional uracil DNA glycosylase
MSLVALSRRLATQCEALRFAAPVACVYNPLVYARAPHEAYLERFGQPPKEVLLIGMNPGPYGMAQTGIPFGDVATVRDWLQIDAVVHKPAREHPNRPVLGLGCGRVEVSGRRLWGWARDRFRSPERFFRRIFVTNYCPLVFLEASGRNRTPDKLLAAEREALAEACDAALREQVAWLRPAHVLGVGVFARDAARRALAGHDLEIGLVAHPSPANPRANRGWAELADAALRGCGVTIDR